MVFTKETTLTDEGHGVLGWVVLVIVAFFVSVGIYQLNFGEGAEQIRRIQAAHSAYVETCENAGGQVATFGESNKACIVDGRLEMVEMVE